MNLPVTLAGYSGRWRFRDAHLLSAWMASRPWDEGGTPAALVRVAAGPGAELVVDAVVREARAHEPDASRLRVERLQAGTGFEEALLGALEVPRPRTRTERLRALGRTLGSSYWLLTVRAGEDGPAVHEEASEFLENCAKAGERPTACVVVLHEGASVSGARDFGVGCFADGILQEAERGQDRLWRAFVASRLAWESAGELGLARELEVAVESIPQASEGRLEEALNGWAARRLAGIPEAASRAMAALVLGEASGAAATLAGLDADLRRTGVLWRPVGERRSRPAPWVARAMLLGNPGHEARHLLRAAMVNGPLANEVLRRCFDLESMLVASLWAKHRALEGRLPDAPNLLRRFEQGQLEECRYYPPGCPAAPRDAWGFATLGEVISVAPELGGRNTPETRLLRLRNALAHGHYVSWKAVRDVLELEEEIGVG